MGFLIFSIRKEHMDAPSAIENEMNCGPDDISYI